MFLKSKTRQHLVQPRQHLLQLLLSLRRNGQNPARTGLRRLHSTTRGLGGSICSCHRAATWYCAIMCHRPTSMRLTASFVAHCLIGRRQNATRSRSLVGHVNMRTDHMFELQKYATLRLFCARSFSQHKQPLSRSCSAFRERRFR